MLMSESCVACILNQVERVARIHRLGRRETLSLIREVIKGIVHEDWDVPPPVLAEGVYRIISQFLGKEDPYGDIKSFYTKALLKIYPKIVKEVEKSREPLKTALMLSAVGNSIDFGAEVKEEVKVEAILEYLEGASFHIDHSGEFFRKLKSSQGLVVIGDNAGETVLDRLFIEFLKREMNINVFYITRGKPVINDATFKDALEAGIGELGKIVDDGNGIPGFVPDRAKKEAKELFYGPFTVLSKGQGNFETLSGIDREVFMAFKVKCEPVSRYLEVPKGSYLFMKNGSS